MSAPHGVGPHDSSARQPSRAPRRGLRPLSGALLLGGLIGGVLLVVADFSTLIEVTVITVVKDRVTGAEQHTYALVLLGALAVPMAAGAALGRSRPAAAALAGLGLIALLIALIGDLPDVEETGLTKTFEAADASPARGFYRETLGAIVLLVTGIANLLLNGSRREADVTRPGQAAPPGAAGIP